MGTSVSSKQAQEKGTMATWFITSTRERQGRNLGSKQAEEKGRVEILVQNKQKRKAE